MLIELRRLLDHARWAETILFTAFHGREDIPEEALRELGHVIGASELWLSRLEHRESRSATWPNLPLADLQQLFGEVDRGYAAYLGRIEEADLARPVAYVNSAGQAFETSIRDVLLHVMLHAQYHRGKINLVLRQNGLQPAPTDYIAFVRGVPAATTPLAALPHKRP